jgi:hypothetical protein
MSQEQQIQKLATQAAETGIRSFVSRIIKAIKSKGLTVGKVMQIYSIAEKAVSDIEAIVKSK